MTDAADSVAVFALALACSTQSGSVPASADRGAAGEHPAASGAQSGAPESGGSGGGGAGACSGPGYQEPPALQIVRGYAATFVDLDGAFVPNMLVQICGLDVCLAGQTDSAGRLEVTLAEDVAIDRPALKYGAGRDYAQFALRLPAQPTVDLGVQRAVRLPAVESSVELVPAARVTHGGLTLELAREASVEVDALVFTTEAERGLRAVRIPIDQAPDAVDPELGLELLYATTPVGTTICPPPRLTVENFERWPAGTAVEVMVHGVGVDQRWAPYGGWAKVADGVVTDDADRITTTDGGVPVLGVLGIRRSAAP